MKFPHYWMCWHCATEMGGVFPEGHCCTVTIDTCKYCDGKKQTEPSVIPWVDFDWPETEKTDRVAKALRD